MHVVAYLITGRSDTAFCYRAVTLNDRARAEQIAAQNHGRSEPLVTLAEAEQAVRDALGDQGSRATVLSTW